MKSTVKHISTFVQTRLMKKSKHQLQFQTRKKENQVRIGSNGKMLDMDRKVASSRLIRVIVICP